MKTNKIEPTPSQVIDAWAALYETLPPPLGPGEKTITTIAREANIDPSTARKKVDQWVVEGKVKSVGLRRISGRETEAFVVIEGVVNH